MSDDDIDELQSHIDTLFGVSTDSVVEVETQATEDSNTDQSASKAEPSISDQSNGYDQEKRTDHLQPVSPALQSQPASVEGAAIHSAWDDVENNITAETASAVEVEGDDQVQSLEPAFTETGTAADGMPKPVLEESAGTPEVTHTH